MKLATLHRIVTALDGPHHALAVAVLREEFDGAIEPQLPLQPDEATRRRDAARDRKRMSRANRVTKRDGHTSVTPDVTPEIPSPSSSLSSHSLSISREISERESESRSGDAREVVTVTRLVTSPVTQNVTRDGHTGERYVTVTDEPDDEIVAIAQMVGVQDPESAWLKFTGHYAGKWVHVAGAWQKWCATEAKHERTERERERDRAKSSAAPLTAEGLDPNSFEACQLRKKRQKAADAEFFQKRLAVAKANGEVK